MKVALRVCADGSDEVAYTYSESEVVLQLTLSNIDDYYTADPTSYSYVRYLINTTRIINLSRKELLTEAFEWKKAGDIKLAKNIYKIMKEAQYVFIVEYIIRYLCLGYSKNIDFLSDSKEMLLYYKIGIFSRVAKSYNEYATECYNRIIILNGKFVDIKNRDAYVGKDLNIPPPNHKERRSELAKKGLLKKAYKKSSCSCDELPQIVRTAQKAPMAY